MYFRPRNFPTPRSLFVWYSLPEFLNENDSNTPIMINLLKTLSFLAVGLIGGIVVHRYFLTAPSVICCADGESCSLEAPDSMTVSLNQTALAVSWVPVNGVSKYLVNVYDLNSDTIAAASKIVEGVTTTIEPFDFNQNQHMKSLFPVFATIVCRVR